MRPTPKERRPSELKLRFDFAKPQGHHGIGESRIGRPSLAPSAHQGPQGTSWPKSTARYKVGMQGGKYTVNRRRRQGGP